MVDIEVIGLCGSGKTTLFSKVQSYLLQKNQPLIVVHKPLRIRTFTCYICVLWSLLKMVCVYPRSILLSFSSFRWLLKKVLYRKCFLQKCFFTEEYIKLDSGLLMPLVEYATHHNNDDVKFNIKQFLCTLPMPSKVLIVTTPLEVSMCRYAQRETVEIKNIIRGFQQGANMVKYLRQILQEQGVLVLEISPIDTVQEIIAKITNKDNYV